MLFSLFLVLALPLAPRHEARPAQEPPAEQGDAEAGKQDHGKKLERFFLPRGRKTPLYMELAPVEPDPRVPLLVLFHEARSSVGEYRPILPHLRALGYACLMVDLVTGGPCNEVVNRTALSAAKAGRSPTYLDAIPDMQDALVWAREHHTQGKVIAWGSGSSAALALQMAGEHKELVDGVIALSPGEFFTALGKSPTWIRDSAALVECPVLVSSARSEENEWKAIFAAVKSPLKTSFLPEGAGTHGTRALWPENKSQAEYWTAVEAFLRQHFPVPAAETPPKDG